MPPWSSRPGPAARGRPSVGLFEIPNSTRGFEAAFQTKYLFEQVWDLPFADVTAATSPRASAGIDVLVIPDGFANYAPAGARRQGQAGAARLGQRRRPDRRLAGRRGGRREGRRISTRPVSADSHTNAPGTLIRVSRRPDEPAGRGHRRPGAGSCTRTTDDASPVSASSVATFPASGDARLRHVRPRDRGRHARRHVRARRRGRSARDGSSRSRSTRTSAPGRRARSGCCGTRSSGPDPAGFGHRGRGRFEGAGRRREGCCRCRRRGAASSGRPSGSGSLAADAAATAKILARHGAEVVRSRCRWRCALPRRQSRRPLVRGASVLRARRPRPREGGSRSGRPACRRAHARRRVRTRGRDLRALDRANGPRLSSVDLQAAYFLCIQTAVAEIEPGGRPRGRQGDQDRRRAPGNGPRRRRGAVREPVRPGAGAGSGRPPRRQPARPDLRGRARRAVERLALAALEPRQRPRGGRADPQPHRGRARGPLGAGQVPGRHHAVLHLAHRPRRPRRPDPPPGHPDRVRARGVHGDDGGLARRGPPLPGARARPPLPGPGPDARHDAVRVVLPVLHAVADRGRPHPELQQPRSRGAARIPAPDPAGPRRPDLRRRWPDPRAQAVREDPARPARDPAHRDHPDRVARAGVPAAAHRRRAVRGPREVPPALDQPALQPPQRDHARRSRARSTS